mgnify:CR=1 FL=1
MPVAVVVGMQWGDEGKGKSLIYLPKTLMWWRGTKAVITPVTLFVSMRNNSSCISSHPGFFIKTNYA